MGEFGPSPEEMGMTNKVPEPGVEAIPTLRSSETMPMSREERDKRWKMIDTEETAKAVSELIASTDISEKMKEELQAYPQDILAMGISGFEYATVPGLTEMDRQIYEQASMKKRLQDNGLNRDGGVNVDVLPEDLKVEFMAEVAVAKGANQDQVIYTLRTGQKYRDALVNRIRTLSSDLINKTSQRNKAVEDRFKDPADAKGKEVARSIAEKGNDAINDRRIALQNEK